ncbi:hypothetical protein GGI07_000666 [Coemansia sp. Benny D115]|nr:hypothetical protein GGI07_000666 [Coemansia sp. Benny D115]
MPAKPTATPLSRQLTIKTGALRRLLKDRQGYIDEIPRQQAHIKSMRDENKHDADIRKQNEVLEETVNMVPHIEAHITKYVQDLENLVATIPDTEKESDEFVAAQKIIEEANAAPSEPEALGAADV